ncbi:MAG: hypothetical protein A2X94_00870 [Bdellovibrionales bacterium GWB1_55_8]|nr:MAG: hypothetical protein A2X94_00870 [Bdellovibrionales bacterium GWB1_55_8]
MKHLFVLIALLPIASITTQVRADSLGDVLSGQVVGKAQESLLRKLANELSPAFKELSRDVYVYHWGKCQYQTKNDPAFPANDAYAREVVQRLMLWTYRKDKSVSGNMGTSYYASTDPVDTDVFGDCLTETRLPAKTRFLDQRNTGSFGYGLQLLLQREGCYASTLAKMFQAPNSDPCHEIITRLVLALGVSAVAYDYSGATAAECTSREHKGAFILVNPTLAGEKYTKVFNPAHAPNDGQHEDRSRIKGLVGKFAGLKKMWPTLLASSAEEWIKDHVFGCNPEKYPEDKVTDPLDFKNLPELDFAARIPTWGVLPPIGDDCCDIGAGTQPQDGIIKARAAFNPVIRALLNDP